MNPKTTALILFDLQNNFLHPEGSYHRAGLGSPAVDALPGKLAPLAKAARERGILVVATQFTVVHGRDGEPIIAPELKALRPFLNKGDFAPGSWNHQLNEMLGSPDVAIEKIAYSAFHHTRLEWVLRKCGIEHLYCAGIVTHVGVSTSIRDAHSLEFACTLVEDGCGTFREEDHRTAVAGIRAVARVITLADAMREFGA